MPKKNEAAQRPAIAIISVSEAALNTTDAGFDKLCKSIQTRGQSLQKDMHTAACIALSSAIKHNDIRRADKLLSVMPESARTNALRTWFEFYGPVKFEKNKPVFDRSKLAKADLKAAIQEPFWRLVPEPVYQPIDEFKAIDDLMKRLRVDAEKTNRDHTPVLDGLQKLKLSMLSAKNPETVEQAQAIA